MHKNYTWTERQKYFFSILAQAPIHIILGCAEAAPLFGTGTLAIIAASLLFKIPALLFWGLPVFYIGVAIRVASNWSTRKFSVFEIIDAYIELGTSFLFYYGLSQIFFGNARGALFYLSVSAFSAALFVIKREIFEEQ